MGYEKLHRVLKSKVAQAQRRSTWFNATERLDLLPALQAMHDLVSQPGKREYDPNKPTWEQECILLGVNAATVRQWKRRTATDTDIRHILGERPPEPKQQRSTDGDNKAALALLERLTKAVLNGEDIEAEHLAAAAAERFQF